MELKNLFSRESTPEQFLSVKLSTSGILATTWEVRGGKIEIGIVAKETVVGDNWLASFDAVVSKVIHSTQPKTIKTIFGVPANWTLEGKITNEKLQMLREVCKKLDLSPLGFILLPEALENYFKETEGVPLTAILIGIDENKGWVTVYRAGKNLGTKEIEFQDDFDISILEGALKDFSQAEVLPARVIIYDGQRDLSVFGEKLNAHHWNKQLPFLHLPKVECLSGEFLVRAVAMAGGMQMGGEIEVKESPKETTEVQEVTAQEAGFVNEEHNDFSVPVRANNYGSLKELSPQETITPAKLPKISFPKIPNISLPKFNFKNINFKFGAKAPLGIIGAIIVCVVAIGLALYFVPKAKIIVHLTPKSFDHQMEATVSGQIIDATEIGTKKGVTTGKKLVGDRAKGAVTVYSAGSSKLFAAGTQITSPDGLKFSLDTDTSVASASDFLHPASTKATITAVDIGDKYNLNADKSFSIGGFSTSVYLAKNDSAFFGGNSHEATVVTELDQDRLFATLSAELTSKAKSDLEAKLISGQTLLPNAITFVISQKKFSKDVDAEAEIVSLDLTMDFKGVIVSKEQLVAQYISRFSSDIPSDYTFDNESSNLEIKSTRLDKTGNAVLSTHLIGRSALKLDTTKIINEILGKDISFANRLITQTTGVSGIEMSVSPKILQSLIEKMLPRRAANISIETVIE